MCRLSSRDGVKELIKPKDREGDKEGERMQEGILRASPSSWTME